MLDRNLLLVTGKGGTGRSAVTASLAIAAARRGKRVLALAMGDSRGLGSHLGVDRRLSHRPSPAASTMAAEIDPAHALDEYLALRLRTGRAAAIGRMFHVLAEAVPGVRDTVMTGKALYEASRSRWDLVVVDCPPTGQVGSYLTAPDAIEGLVPTGTVRDQATWMRERLADPEFAGLVVVATAEELPVAEALQVVEEAEGLCGVAAVVANRLVPAPSFNAASAGRLPVGPAREAALLHHSIYSRQGEHLDALGPDHRLAYQFGVHTAPEVARRLALRWSP